MYVSRLSFSVHPGHTHDVEQALGKLAELVEGAGLGQTRILRTSYASLGAADLEFEQEAPTLAALEDGIARITGEGAFQQWSAGVTPWLLQTPKREVFRRVR